MSNSRLRRIEALVGSAILVLVLASPALAGETPPDTAGGQKSYVGCTPKDCAFSYNISSANHIDIAPGHSSIHTYNSSSSATISMDPPDWGNGNWGRGPDAYKIRVNFRFNGITNLGSNWQLAVCGPHSCPMVYRTGSPAIQEFQYNDPSISFTLRMSYIGAGSTNGASTTTIIGRVQIQWIGVDNTPPTLGLSINGGPFKPYFNANDAGDDGKLEIDAAADDNTAIGGISASVNGKAVPVSGEGSFTVDNGENNVYVLACDIASNCTSSTGTARFDSVPPQVTLVNPNMVFTTSTPQVPFKANDPSSNGYFSGLKSASLMLGGSPVDSIFGSAGGIYTVQPKPLNDGIYDVNVQVTDAAGNSGNDPNGGSMIIDTTPPTLAPASPLPAPNPYSVAEAPTTITATANDNTGVHSGSIELDDTPLTATLDNPDTPGSTNLSYDLQSDQCPGIHKVHAEVTDEGGHTTATDWTYKVVGAVTTSCRRGRCRTARTAVKQFSKVVQDEARQLRKMNSQLRRAVRASHHGRKADRAAAKDAAANLRAQIAPLKLQYRNDSNKLHKARKSRSHNC